MVQSETYASHPTVFLNQPFAAPHQSALPVPKSRQVCQLPLGGSQGVLTLHFQHSSNRSVPSAWRADAIRPYSGVCIQPAAAQIPRFSLSIVTGRVREPTYWYKPGAALKKDACFAAAPRPRVSKRPCLQEKLYFGSGFLSILFGCLILPKLASFDLHKFIYFTKMDGEAGKAENYT